MKQEKDGNEGEEPDWSSVNQNHSGAIGLLSGYVTLGQNGGWDILTRGGLIQSSGQTIHHGEASPKDHGKWKVSISTVYLWDAVVMIPTPARVVNVITSPL